MRFIDTESQKPPQAWLQRSDELTRELIRLHQAGDIAGRNKLIDDNSQHWGEIKEWLARLSHRKCWFSEARDIYSHLDVEHFRPKKEAKALDGSTRDGYWWLAFDYRNFRLSGNVGNRKKGGWFPLRDGSLMATGENHCEESEEPYLLDPTNPFDVTLIVFNEEGLAQPASQDPNSWEYQRAALTIDRLKFNEHEALAEERKRVWQETSRDIEGFLTAVSRTRSGPNPAAIAHARSMALKIKERVRPEAELSAVAKICVQFRNDPNLIMLCH
jgi:hypothetical protein